MKQDLINAARLGVSAGACICMVLTALRARRVRLMNDDRFAVWATAALLIGMAFIVIAQLRQLGHPLATWWGMPMLSAMVVCNFRALWRSKI